MRLTQFFSLNVISLQIISLTVLVVGVVSVSRSAYSAEESPLVTVVGGTVSIDDTRPDTQTSFSKVITREQFKTTTGSVADVLKQESGVQLRQRGGLGASSSIYLRGSDSQQVNVYLDGLLMNASAGGGVDLSQFLLNSVASVEIYPDVTPVQLGFPNLAGAVNIKTRKTGESVNDVQIGTGSFGSKNAGVHFNNSSGPHSALLAAEYLGADNDYDILNDNGTEFNKFDDRVEPRKNADFRQSSALIKYDYAIATDLGLQLMLLDNRKNQSLPSINNANSTRTSLETQSQQIQSRVYGKFDRQREWSLRIYHALSDEYYDDRQSRVGLGENWTRSDTKTYGINPSLAWRLDTHLLTFSLDTKLDTYDQKNLLRGEASPEWRRKGINLGLQDEWQNTDGDLLITPAMSIFWIEDEGNLSGLNSQEDINRSDRYETARLGARYLIDTKWAIKGNIASNIRLPSLYELMGDRGYFVGQPTLSPEKSLAKDLGLEYSKPSTTASLVIFHRTIDDVLVVSYDSRGVGRYSNIAEAEISGVELRVDQSLPANFVVMLRSTVQNPRDRTDRALEGDKLLPNVYRQASSVGLIHRLENIENRLDYSLEEGGFYAPGESVSIPTKRVLDYSIRYRWNEVQLALEARNLLDDQYEDFNRYPAPGRNYFIKATKEF